MWKPEPKPEDESESDLEKENQKKMQNGRKKKPHKIMKYPVHFFWLKLIHKKKYISDEIIL